MIEELRDYLIQHGVAEDMADEVHGAHYRDGERGVREYTKSLGENQYEYEDLLIALCHGWEIEAGEATIEEIIRRVGSEYLERQLYFLDRSIVGDLGKPEPGRITQAQSAESVDPARLAPGVLDWERDRELPEAEIRDARGIRYRKVFWVNPRSGEGERIAQDSSGQAILDESTGHIKRERFRAAVPFNIKWRR